MKLSTINGFDVLLLWVIAALVVIVVKQSRSLRALRFDRACVRQYLADLYCMIVDSFDGNEIEALRRAEAVLRKGRHPFVPTGEGRCRICRRHMGAHGG